MAASPTGVRWCVTCSGNCASPLAAVNFDKQAAWQAFPCQPTLSHCNDSSPHHLQVPAPGDWSAKAPAYKMQCCRADEGMRMEKST